MRWPATDQSLTPVLEALERRNLDPWIVDRAIPQLFGPHWRVVRALIPGCTELSWGMKFRRLRSVRIGEALASGERLHECVHPLA